MKNIEILVEEHDVIIHVLKAFEEEAVQIKKHEKINKEHIFSMLDFFKNFADKFHHAKEEDHLFALLIKKGMERKDSPVESMFLEHEEGRNHLKNVRILAEENTNSKTFVIINKEINAFVNLLRNHIDKENNMIYVMAESFISSEEDTELVTIYKKIANEQSSIIEHYRKYAKELTM